MASVRLRAHAKINLALRILGTRADGYHELRTIFQSIDLHDRLTFIPRRGPFDIRSDAAGLPAIRENLIWKAAQQLWSAAGRDGEPAGAVVALEKRIPMQAGLGGGSSDAATALVGLQRIWKLKVTPEDLHRVAAALGSDVPYFLMGGTALGLGRGEQLFPLADLPRLWVVLAIPQWGVVTKDAYGWWDEAGGVRLQPDLSTKPDPTRKPRLRVFPAWIDVASLENDFEGPVFQRHPTLRDLKTQLMRAGAAMAALSGSGSTVFGVFATERAAKAAARHLTTPRVDVLVSRFRPRQSG